MGRTEEKITTYWKFCIRFRHNVVLYCGRTSNDYCNWGGESLVLKLCVCMKVGPWSTFSIDVVSMFTTNSQLKHLMKLEIAVILLCSLYLGLSYMSMLYCYYCHKYGISCSWLFQVSSSILFHCCFSRPLFLKKNSRLMCLVLATGDWNHFGKTPIVERQFKLTHYAIT